MRFARWITAFAVVAAAGTTLGFIAFSLADREYAEQVAGVDRLLDQEVAVFVRRARAALLPAHDAAVEALRGVAATDSLDDATFRAFVADDGEIRYRPFTPPPAISAEERDRFDRAVLGGESYEFARRDAARAIDAYSFYLERIAHPDLRDRLRLRIARAAALAGRAPLAKAMFLDLLESDSSAEESGLPISLLAGVRWIDLDDRVESREQVRSVLAALASTLATERVAYFTSRIAPEDAALNDFVARRRAFEAELRQLDVSRTNRVILGDTHLLVAEYEPSRSEIAGSPIALPSLGADDLQLVVGSEPGAAAPGSSSQPLRLRDDSATLAWVEIRDPAHGAKIQLAAQRRSVAKLLVALLLVLVGGACVALWIAIDRQRRLAELKVRLLANVSHELKTPITSIRIFSEMLAEDSLDDAKVRQFGRLLTAESRRLTQRIEDLLDYAQEGRAARALPMEQLDVVGLLRPLADTFQYRAKDHRVDFRSDFRTNMGAPRAIRTNANAIERIVLNLLDNALKYRSKESPWIALKMKETSRGLQILVKDNGIGIPTKDQERIFDEFFRARFEEYGVPGTGLGLSIARALAERIHARLFVDSRPNVGSAFVLELPFEIEPPRESQEAVS